MTFTEDSISPKSIEEIFLKCFILQSFQRDHRIMPAIKNSFAKTFRRHFESKKISFISIHKTLKFQNRAKTSLERRNA